MHGQFVISLDFEKFWGVLDSKSLNSYSKNLENVNRVIDKMMALAEVYDVKYTFATVGFLFFENLESLKKALPNLRPSYNDQDLNPYKHIESLERDDFKGVYYSGLDHIKKIKAKGHEIATHTFSHFYCLEKGQTLEDFKYDLEAAIKTAKDYNIDLKSIVFPRNQIHKDYINVCKSLGITSYRGTERHAIYKTKPYAETQGILQRIARILDAYLPISGINTYELKILQENGIINIPSSYFLRPYSNTLKFLEPLKIKRITSSMEYAAKHNELFHLWWHPHNFGNNLDANISNLDKILRHYKNLKKKYNFENRTMADLAYKLSS